MSICYDLADDTRRVVLDCDKFSAYLALKPAPFEEWWTRINDGDTERPDKSDRYRLAEPEARRLHNFLVLANWNVRLIADGECRSCKCEFDAGAAGYREELLYGA